MNRKFCHRQIILILLLIISISGFPGCASATVDSSQTTTAESTSATVKPTADDGKPNAASGVLRLWWSKRKNLNPLLDNSQSGLAINPLIYQGLFAIDASQQIQPILASQIEWSEDGLQAVITLNSGLLFHNGQALTANDPVACLNFIKARAAESAYAAALGGIAAAEAVDARTIRLTLSQPDPWLAWALTFPVIPAARLSAGPFEIVQGTGPFRMQTVQAGSGLILVKANPAGTIDELTTIQVMEYANLSAAMQAYESDKLDLVSLPSDEYRRYMLRNSLRFEQYVGNQCLFLAYNTKKRPLSESGRLLYLKQLMDPDKLSMAGAGVWGECTAVPLSAASWLLGGQPARQQELLAGLGKPTWNQSARELVLLLPEGDSFRQELAGLVGARLTAAGIKWRLQILPEANYLPALTQGQYDLALLEAVLPAAPDATWLYRDDRAAAYALLNSLTVNGLTDYPVWRQRLLQANQTRSASLEDYPYLTILNETAARSAWSVLLIRSAAVLYGDRVIGQCQPDRYNPFRGIEELWIWSGQSS